jgi:hypothetical protein
MRTLLVLAMLAFAAPARAAGCRETRPVIIGGTQGYVMAYGDKCMVSIDPSYTPDLVYRSYAFYEDGLLMVFNSFGDGPDIARLTAAREFYFFPRSSPLGLQMDEVRQSVAVVMANGDRVDFAAATGQPSALSRGAVSVAPAVEPANRGGVEFPRYAGLLLDLGFARGHSPSARPENDAFFRDAAGQTCAVKMKEVFDYTPDGEHVFKYADAKLVNWLRFRCPFLDPGFAAPDEPVHARISQGDADTAQSSGRPRATRVFANQLEKRRASSAAKRADRSP